MHPEHPTPGQYCKLAREFSKAGCSDRQVLRMLLNSMEKLSGSDGRCDKEKSAHKFGGGVGNWGAGR